jgi:hypothetical protein
MELFLWICAILFAIWVLWMICKPRRPSYSSDGIEILGSIIETIADVGD